jgi:NAD(P)-dependent dehydrogenase (short-subunit alcohol dehydrogenase family)
MLLERRATIITGTASPRGIGNATAQLFAEHGARIAIVDLPTAAGSVPWPGWPQTCPPTSRAR